MTPFEKMLARSRRYLSGFRPPIRCWDSRQRAWGGFIKAHDAAVPLVMSGQDRTLRLMESGNRRVGMGSYVLTRMR